MMIQQRRQIDKFLALLEAKLWALSLKIPWAFLKYHLVARNNKKLVKKIGPTLNPQNNTN